MLSQLRIRGFAIVDELTVEFAPGMNVLTGETGAGKSIVVDAIGLLRGGRASADWIRTGADEARVEAVFELPGGADGALGKATRARLEAAGVDPADDGALLVRRVISRTGRGKVYLNGALATAGTLADVVAPLVDVAGQHEHQSLTDPARHLEVLDAFANATAKRRECEDAYEALRAALTAEDEAKAGQHRTGERVDWLRFQVKEIDDAKLTPGEDAELSRERERLRASTKLASGARRAVDVLYAGEGAASDSLASILRELEPLAAIDPRLGPACKELSEARVLVDDAAESLRRYADAIEDDPARLAEVEDRQATIGKLLRKHGEAGATVADLLRRRDAMQTELDNFERGDERMAALAQAVEKARVKTIALHDELSRMRGKAGRQLATKAAERLAGLGMKGAQLEVQIEPRLAQKDDPAAMIHEKRRLSASGWDRVELLFSGNVGEDPRPLGRVASGGELSRVMLAIKRVLARADAVTTYLFDEVDAGIGGAIAEVVGRELAEVARHGQVVCITHAPQIAAFAEAHFRVEKKEDKGRTATSVRLLDDGERGEELARMLGGVKITAKTREHAQEMLRAAREA